MDVPADRTTRRFSFRRQSLFLTRRASARRRLVGLFGHGLLLLITAASALAVLFIFYFIARDALPFFQARGVTEFFTSVRWYPTGTPPSFGAAAIFLGSGLVTLGAILVAVPLGIFSAVCLSDVLPFAVRQAIKPVIELLAAIPSVAYGFFALVVFAPLLQSHGGAVLAIAWCCIAPAPLIVGVFLATDAVAGAFCASRVQNRIRASTAAVLGLVALVLLIVIARQLAGIEVSSGTNALNVALVLGVMALPTVMSVSEDALQAVGRDLREGAYALGATRAEVLTRVVLPAAASGLCAAVILGIMRAIGETMVVWMASGNAAQVPQPWYNLLDNVRTLTATIAGDMGEADQTTGSERYHVLFAMGLALLVISFICNLISERVIARSAARYR